MIFPLKSAETSTAVQQKGTVLPIKQLWTKEKARPITEEERAVSNSAYATLRKARSDARLVGVREVRRKAKEEEEATKKK